MQRVMSLSRVYSLLEPGPVVLLTSHWRGRDNVMTMSWHSMMEFVPPLVGCVISGNNHSCAMVRASRECVINIPTVELADAVVGCGNCSGREVDKFERFALRTRPASRVSAPRLVDCHASLECRVVETRLANRYDFLVLEVVRAWRDTAVTQPRTLHHCGWGEFMVAGERIRLHSAMP